MSEERLRFSTDILRRLGEELNQGADQGILELVRNAYDADATTCTVTFEGLGEVGGLIVVEDDGDGMDVEAIRDGWLVVGRSPEAYAETNEAIEAEDDRRQGNRTSCRLTPRGTGTAIDATAGRPFA